VVVEIDVANVESRGDKIGWHVGAIVGLISNPSAAAHPKVGVLLVSRLTDRADSPIGPPPPPVLS
jgi:hypothetical protein